LGGTVSLDEKVSFEVDLLAHRALADATLEIGRRVKVAAAGNTIVFVSDDLKPSLETYCAFLLQTEVLRDTFKATQSAVLSTLQLLNSHVAEQTNLSQPPTAHLDTSDESLELAIAPGVTAAAVATTIQSAANLLSFFRSDLNFIGRPVVIGDIALVTSLAHGLLTIDPSTRCLYPPWLLSQFGAGRKSVFRSEIESVLKARLAAESVIAEISSRIPLLSAGDGRIGPARASLDTAQRQFDLATTSLQSLEAAGNKDSPARTIQAIDDLLEAAGKEPVTFLTAKILTAGGSYRIRRTLWDALCGNKRLSYSGGVIVAFALVAASGQVLCADTVRRWYPHTRFTETEENGISANSLSETAARPGAVSTEC
jgi:hypothetical protein